MRVLSRAQHSFPISSGLVVTSREVMPSGDFKRWGTMTSSANQAGTGVLGLDDVLQGGLSRGHVFLLEGEPGAGKTTIALAIFD